MIDVKSLIKAMKCRWVERLKKPSDDSWKAVVEYYFKDFGGTTNIFCYNLDRRGLTHVTKKLPKFYKDVLNSWYEIVMYKDKVRVTPNNVGEQVIWGNHHITCNNVPLFFPEWIESDIMNVSDLFQKGNFMRQNYLLANLKNKRKWMMQYLTLKNAIPYEWKRCMLLAKNFLCVNRDRKPIMKKDHAGKYKDLNQFACKDFYWNIVNKIVLKSYAPMIWANRYNIECENWALVWNLKVKYTIVKKMAQFNYYLIYDKIPHRLNLWKWKKAEDPECEICKCMDDCKHFLFDCSVIAHFWRKLIYSINVVYKTNIKLSWKHIIFGYMLDYEKFGPLNVIIIVAVFCVYKARIVNEINIWRFLIEELSCINVIKNDKTIEELLSVL